MREPMYLRIRTCMIFICVRVCAKRYVLLYSTYYSVPRGTNDTLCTTYSRDKVPPNQRKKSRLSHAYLERGATSPVVLAASCDTKKDGSDDALCVGSQLEVPCSTNGSVIIIAIGNLTERRSMPDTQQGLCIYLGASSSIKY